MSHVMRSGPSCGLFTQKLGRMISNAAGTFAASTYLTIAAGPLNLSLNMTAIPLLASNCFLWSALIGG